MTTQQEHNLQSIRAHIKNTGSCFKNKKLMFSEGKKAEANPPWVPSKLLLPSQKAKIRGLGQAAPHSQTRKHVGEEEDALFLSFGYASALHRTPGVFLVQTSCTVGRGLTRAPGPAPGGAHPVPGLLSSDQQSDGLAGESAAGHERT